MFGGYSERIIPNVDVFVMSLWEDVSSIIHPSIFIYTPLLCFIYKVNCENAPSSPKSCMISRPHLLFYMYRHYSTPDLWDTDLYPSDNFRKGNFNFLSRSHCITRFEMLDAAKNKVRVKISYVMIALTVAGCILMVIEGKKVRVDFPSIFVYFPQTNIEEVRG